MRRLCDDTIERDRNRLLALIHNNLGSVPQETNEQRVRRAAQVKIIGLEYLDQERAVRTVDRIAVGFGAFIAGLLVAWTMLRMM